MIVWKENKMTKKKKFNPKITMEADKGGASFWQNGLWILDASTFLDDGEIYIDSTAFKVTINDDIGRIILTAKKSPKKKSGK
jgi:hypothetical protein